MQGFNQIEMKLSSGVLYFLLAFIVEMEHHSGGQNVSDKKTGRNKCRQKS